MRAYTRYFIKLLFTAAIFVLIASNLQVDSVLTHVSEVEIPFILAAFATFTTAIFVNSFRLQVLLNRGHHLVAYTYLLKIHFIGLFFSIFLPGRTVGDVVRAYYLTRSTTWIENAVSTLVIWRLIGGLTMISVACIAAFISYPILRQITLIYYSLGILIVIIIVLYLALRPHLLKSLFSRLRFHD